MSLRKAAWSSYRGSIWEKRRLSVSSGIESSLDTSSRNHWDRDRFKQVCIHFFKFLFTYQIDHFEVLFICSLGHEDFFRNEICLVCRMTLENKESFKNPWISKMISNTTKFMDPLFYFTKYYQMISWTFPFSVSFSSQLLIYAFGSSFWHQLLTWLARVWAGYLNIQKNLSRIFHKCILGIIPPQNFISNI